MIVTRQSFQGVIDSLHDEPILAEDTETTGLDQYGGDDEPFSIIIAAPGRVFYFNYNDYPDFDQNLRLEWGATIPALQRLFAKRDRVWLFFNAKFDLGMLRKKGIRCSGLVHDSMIISRLLDSNAPEWGVSLDHCAWKTLGERKLDTVKAHLKANGIIKEGGAADDYDYALAPWELIVPYGERDADLTFRLGMHQRQAMADIVAGLPPSLPPLTQVYENECRLVPVVLDMEATGVMIDRGFCLRAIERMQGAQDAAAGRFESVAGEPFMDSPALFKRVFASDKERWVLGEPSAVKRIRSPKFDEDALETFENPAARAVLEYRKAKSNGDFYRGFIAAADRSDIVRTTLNQHVARTGRFSSSNPNLQNLSKADEEALQGEFTVRRAIVPRPGNVFHMLDYRQVEYRMLLNYAGLYAKDKDGILALIEKVLGGLDIHQATADLAGITRTAAKTVNFATIYGSGIALLAKQLKCTVAQAYAIKNSILNAAPEIGWLIAAVKDAARLRGYIVNWFGRVSLFPDASDDYKALNYLLQGGCADAIKIAMVEIHEYLAPFETKLVLQVHDEIVLEGPVAEAAVVIPAVNAIMDGVYKARFVPLTCGVEHSFTSLADKKEGIACVAA